MTSPAISRHVRTPVLDIAYEEAGPQDGVPIILLHGFPYDVRCYDAVVPRLAAAGCRALVPYLRGYGPTKFLSAQTPRSGQQAALGNDLKEFMDALGIERAALAGYDWGGRAACIVAALWAERVRCLVSQNGYNIQDLSAAAAPLPPEQEYRYWYQYYFNTERGRAGLARNRRPLCRLLWRLWSPNWRFDDATFERTASSFDNADFVEVSVHSYRVRWGYAPGDPAVADIERRLAQKPKIGAPTIALCGEADGVTPPELSEAHAKFFSGPYQRRVIARAGHNLPQEEPQIFADAVLELAGR
jgi:pimeloyl-ACP methyl ester carboxylesterase